MSLEPAPQPAPAPTPSPEAFPVELLELQRHLEAHNQRMIVLFEGRDVAGKGGTIRRVTERIRGGRFPS